LADIAKVTDPFEAHVFVADLVGCEAGSQFSLHVPQIAIEAIETRFPWRGFWQDWFTAGVMAVIYWLASLVVSGASLTPEMLTVAAPQALASVLLYPIIARAVAGLDRYRLSRARTID
jgi:rod shape-determining protein MreD